MKTGYGQAAHAFAFTVIRRLPSSSGLKILLFSFVFQKGETALHFACQGKNLEAAKWLTVQMSFEAIMGVNQVKSRV